MSGSLNLWNNGMLTNVDGLSGMTLIGINLSVFLNSNIQNLNRLSALTKIGGYLYIQANVILANLDGLSALTSIGGDIFLRNNDELTILEAYCGLFNLLNSNLRNNYSVSGNGYDPERAEIIDPNGPCYVAQIPTMGQWGLIICGLLVFTMGVVGIRYKETNGLVGLL